MRDRGLLILFSCMSHRCSFRVYIKLAGTRLIDYASTNHYPVHNLQAFFAVYIVRITILFRTVMAEEEPSMSFIYVIGVYNSSYTLSKINRE